VFNAIAPSATARIAARSAVAAGARGAEGDRAKHGRESESAWTPSLATSLSDRAAVPNTEA
jgi:hypothetical protein